MSRSLRRLLTVAVGFVTVAATGPALSVQASTDTKFAGINHIVVIFEDWSDDQYTIIRPRTSYPVKAYGD